MSRAVALRWNGLPVEARISRKGDHAVLETGERRVEAVIAREGAWIDLAIGGRTLRAATARDARGIWVALEGRLYRFETLHRHAGERVDADDSGEVLAPMTGRVAAVEARAGATVREGDLLLTIEAMKMEFKVSAPASGVVRDVACAPGDRVELGQLLARIAPAAPVAGGDREGP
ncbi:MAG TPA: biotin/lipoyl-containing protein [Candidatus Binatia bacterium]|nr:biotin/lipoyl-containing protein [Candidatus Binatia bacterium]